MKSQSKALINALTVQVDFRQFDFSGYATRYKRAPLME
jgi:hypothetical protein